MHRFLVRREAPLKASSATLRGGAQKARAAREYPANLALLPFAGGPKTNKRWYSENIEYPKGGSVESTRPPCTPRLAGLAGFCLQPYRVQKALAGAHPPRGRRERACQDVGCCVRTERHYDDDWRWSLSSNDDLLGGIASGRWVGRLAATYNRLVPKIWAAGGGGAGGGAEAKRPAEVEEEEEAPIEGSDNDLSQGEGTTTAGATPTPTPTPTPAPTEETFRGSFTQQEPIPKEGIDAALAVLHSGRLHRYNTAPGELSHTALLEQEFAALTGARFCVAVASGGYAMSTALRALGVRPGDKVLSNAFTLAPVPGAIAAVGAEPVFVGVTESLTIDLDDLEAKVVATAGTSGRSGGGGDGRAAARVLLLSHMRGHICDMDRLVEICRAAGVVVVEDCAHTMGAAWNGVPSGRHGTIGCFSCQTYKHVNSGEGGFFITDDEELAARAVVLSGSYMLYERHLTAPKPEVFERVKYVTPNVSGRMDNLRAAILRPQLRDLSEQVARWNSRYGVIEGGLRGTPGLRLCDRVESERFVGSSFQFLLLGWPAPSIERVLRRCAARGVELKWFGAPEPVAFTSRYDSWRYAASEPMPETDAILAGVVDMRVPLTFSLEDCAMIARIVRDEVSKAGGPGGGGDRLAAATTDRA